MSRYPDKESRGEYRMPWWQKGVNAIAVLGIITGAAMLGVESYLAIRKQKLLFAHHSQGIIFGIAGKDFPSDIWNNAPPFDPPGFYGLKAGKLEEGGFEGWELNW